VEDDDWKPPESAWVVIGSGTRFSVDDEEYRRIKAQLPKPGTPLTHAIYIEFTDVMGAEVELPFTGYFGIFHTTKQTRIRDSRWIEAIRADERSSTPKDWQDKDE
jgi:hypothetical protein